MITKSPLWLTPLLPFMPSELPEEVQTSVYRYLLTIADKDGIVYDEKKNPKIVETGASLYMLLVSGKLKNRILDKVIKTLKSALKKETESDGELGKKGAANGLKLDYLLKIALTIKFFDTVSGINLFDAIGQNPLKLAKRYLLLFKKADGCFADTDVTGESSLAQTGIAAYILHCSGGTLGDFDPNLSTSLPAYLQSHQKPMGGFYESQSNKLCSISNTLAGIYLSKLLNIEKNLNCVIPQPDNNENFSAERAFEFLNRLRTPEGGYRSDGLFPSPDLLNTVGAILSLGMINGYRFGLIPEREKTIQYILSLKCRDGGFAASQWVSTSDPISTVLALVTLYLLDGFDHYND